MMKSPSLSRDAPSDAQLEIALCDAVKKIFATGSLENLTVKRVRATVERELDLGEGYFKNAKWKDRSKAVIEREAQKHDEPASAATKNVSPAKPIPAKLIPQSSATPTDQPQKKRKIIESIEKDEDDEERSVKRKSKSLVDSKAENETTEVSRKRSNPQPSKKGKTSEVVRRKAGVVVSDDDSSLSVAASPSPPPAPGNASTARTDDMLGDSDLSEVFDEGPKPKCKKKTSGKKPDAQSKRPGKSKPKDLNPQAEEIKNLQGWLAKCGIRKVWGKELKVYDTSRDKIKHLKQILSDVGMTGRYSKEKAASIRETRELAADLEAVQEGAKLWGKEGEDSDRAERKRSTRTATQTFEFIEYDSEE